MENSCQLSNGNGHVVAGHSPNYQGCIKGSLPWLDLRVFYVRVCKCEIDECTPLNLRLNHIPLNPDTLLEVNGVRTRVNYDGELSTLLRRDRLDKKSEEATFVSTDGTRITGTLKFEVFDKDVQILSGVLELCTSNGHVGESNDHVGNMWIMRCESDISESCSFLKGKQFMDMDSTSPAIEVYIAGSFLGAPIVLTKTLQLGNRKKNDANGRHKDVHSPLALQGPDFLNLKSGDEDCDNMYSGYTFSEGENGEISCFNAGVRVGVGIGLSICLGIGIAVGLLVRTYQGTKSNFRRRLP